MISNWDLVLMRVDNLVKPYRLGASLAKQLREGQDVKLLGDTFENLGACCEWLQVTDLLDGRPLGVSLQVFYGSVEREAMSGLKADNVIWDEHEGATLLFAKSTNWKVDGGPFLPVDFLKGKNGGFGYLVAEALAADYGDVPVIEEP